MLAASRSGIGNSSSSNNNYYYYDDDDNNNNITNPTDDPDTATWFRPQ